MPQVRNKGKNQEKGKNDRNGALILEKFQNKWENTKKKREEKSEK